MTSRYVFRWRWAALAAVAAVALMAAPTAVRADSGPVPTENARPGTPGWYAPTAPQPSEADQFAGRVSSIDGWAWPLSAAPGERVDLHVGTAHGVRYRVEIYRLGWYGGAGARLQACLPSCTSDQAGIVQPLPPPPDPATGEVRPAWPVTDSLTIPSSWPSGFYMAALKITAGTGAGAVRRLPFVVRAPAPDPSRILVVVPVNTWQAYNGWGGKSLYDNHSVDGRRASQVSFERPWMEGVEQSTWRYDEYPLVRFLERKALDVSYVTDQDVSATPGILTGHRVVMVSGHGEYWTHEERDALEAAREAGQSLAFMGANTGYWQVRYANGGRSLVGYKSAADPIADPALKTTHFRDVGRPECTLLGVQYNNTGWDLGTSADLSVVDASLDDPWLAGSGFVAGDTVPEAMGYEWDQVTPGCPTPPLTRLFHWQASGWPAADSVRYTAPSGAKVFAAASLQFSWGLDGWRYNSVPAAPDARLESFTMRMLTDMGGAGDGPPAEPSVVVSPTTASVPTGATQQFAASVQNATGGVQWSVNDVAGGNASVGSISASGLYTAPTAVPAGGSVSVRATHLASGATDAATVSVAAATQPQITTQPAAQTVAAGASATFTAAASGPPTPSVQWQVSINGGSGFTDIAGATSTTLTLSAVTSAQNQSQYRAVFTNSAGTATSSAATLTVTAAATQPQITTQPAAQTVAAGATATFTAAASGSPTPSVQWQVSTNGGSGFTDIAEATSTTLTLSAVASAQNQNQYRAVFTNSAGSATSAAATLTVTSSGGAPANDALAAAQALQGASGTVTGSNVGATKEAGEPSQAGNSGGASVWYSWTPPAGGSATIDTSGSPFDTTLGVYTGTSVGALTLRASNDDVSSSNTTSKVTLTVTAGTTYRISVDGYGARQGAVTLSWVR